MEPPNRRLILQFLLAVSVLGASVHTAAAKCREISNPNPDCVTDQTISPTDACDFEYTIYEDCPVGDNLFDVSGDGVSFGDCEEYFSFSGQSISLKKELDAETKITLACVDFIVSADGFDAMTAVGNIEDVDEFPPELVDTSITNTIHVHENNEDPLLVEFGVKDRDRDEITTLTQTTNFAEMNNIFVLEKKACDDNTCRYELTTTKALDYEENIFYTLEMTFTSGDSRGGTNSTLYTVMLFVEDEPDNPPFWTNPAPREDIEENKPKDTEVCEVTARDRDIGIDNKIKYEIIAGNDLDLFVIDATTGVVRTTESIDREALLEASFDIEIQATEVDDNGDPQPEPNKVSQITNIMVLDMNDNTPEFSEDNVQLNMTELTGRDYKFSDKPITVKDMDQDFGEFDLTTSDPDHFTVSPSGGSGEVSLTMTAAYAEDNIFDFDKPEADTTLEFTIIATERADPSHVGECQVSITIEDANDNAPVLSKEAYDGAIKENVPAQTPVVTVQATDADASEQFGTGSIRYSLKDCDSDSTDFTIDDLTGEVTVADTSRLDYEKQPKITCTVKASDDDDTNSDTATLVVSLQDVNDTPPKITNMAVEYEVAENTELGYPILSVSAIDEDTTAAVSFDLVYPDGTDDEVKGWFALSEVECEEASNGKFCQQLLVDGDIDRENPAIASSPTLQLTIIATDEETDDDYGQQDSVVLEITILDENDESPSFCVSCLDDLKVMENIPIGTDIVQVKATDPDDEDYNALRFSCSDNPYLEINETTGMMSVSGEIDREAIDTIKVTLTVTDTADHQQRQEVTLEVLDRNDEIPVINCSAIESISEGAKHGDYLTTISAEDEDIGIHAEVIFVLRNRDITTGNNKLTPFAVEPDTGDITVYINETEFIVLDRETEEEWTLKLRVYDKCGTAEQDCRTNFADCEMTVIVTDENDEYPKLSEELELSAPEDLKKGSAVEDRVTAVDGDLENTDASQIHYLVVGFKNMVSGSLWEPPPFVAIDGMERNPQGNDEWFCTLQATMDLTHAAGYYNLSIDATDGTLENPGNTNTLYVDFTITDSNDQYPIIRGIGCLDHPEKVIYIYEENYEGGDQIPCIDDGDHDDSNDEKAILTYDDKDLSSPNNKAVLSIDYNRSKAFPKDHHPGQLALFEVLRLEGTELFGIFIKAGSPNISREEANAYNLSIRADDPDLTTHDWVYINVISVSEFYPTFCNNSAGCFYTTYITEETTNIGNFSEATDEDNSDGEENDVIYYFIIGVGNNNFYIPDTLQPALRPKTELDRDMGPGQFDVLVMTSNSASGPDRVSEITGQAAGPSRRLKDSQGPPIQSYMEVTVVLLDINDNAPKFPEPAIIFGSVIKSGSSDQEAAYLKAIDIDLNETLTYSFQGDFLWSEGAYGDVFEIVNDGLVATVILRELPSSLSGYCVVDVLVADRNQTGEHTDDAILQIFVVRAEDQIPFYFQNDIATLQENQENIAVILTDAFDYLAYIDSMTPTSGSDNTTRDSVLSVHFVNASYMDEGYSKQNAPPGNLVPKSIITSMASSGVLSSQLQDDLYKFGLVLYSIGETAVGEDEDLKAQLLTFQILLAVITMVLGSLLFLLLAAYIVRTRKLELRIKVMSTNTFGSQASGLNRAGMDAVPNSNLFRGEGANPMYNTSGQNFNRQDTASISSGDSVLVGVEDNPEFRDYKVGGKRSSSTADAATAGKTVTGPGGMTSSNPLFGGMEMNTIKDADASVSDDGYSDSHSDKHSQEAGDLGTANPNFTFG